MSANNSNIKAEGRHVHVEDVARCRCGVLLLLSKRIILKQVGSSTHNIAYRLP